MASLTSTQFAPKSPSFFWGLLLGLVIVMAAIAFISLRPYLVAEAKLAPGTTRLLQQTATHMSKMQGGVQIGGFPGFEPDDDDDKYQSKVKDSEFSNIDVNDWTKEICNFLEQASQKNPNLSLEQILRLAGLSAKQIEDFLGALRTTYSMADAKAGFGVTVETVDRLANVMKNLGVDSW